MKKLLFLFLFFAVPAFGQSPKTIISSVCFQDTQGNCLANGQLTLDLAQPATILGGGQVAPIRASINLDGTGKIPVGTVLWASDQLSPSGVAYYATLINSLGSVVANYRGCPWVIIGGSPIDLSQMMCTAIGATYPFGTTGPAGPQGPQGPPGAGGGIPFCGPNPFADITCYNARSVTGVPTTANVSCNATSTITFPSDPIGLGFKANDGITVYGCGATNTMSTPGTVSVVPSEAAGETGSGWVVNSPTGSSTYLYCIFSRDKFGAVTPCSATTTITNGQITLGLQTVNISNMLRSNDQVTVVTSLTNQLAALAAIQVESTVSKAFNGWFSVGSITNGTTFVLNATPNDTRGQTWQVGDVAGTGSGGSITYYLGNHLSWTYSTGAWEYYVCAKRPGDSALHLIGVTKPSQSSGYRDVQFDDWGSPYMDGQSYPPYITNANCTGAATNDPLTTTILSINSGAKTAAVANSASQTLGSTTAIFDDGPGFLAAANAVVNSTGGSEVYIPPSSPSGGFYPINSYTKLPSNIAVWQVGYLGVHETIEVDKGITWSGPWGNYTVPQFGFTAGPLIESSLSFPALYINGFGNVFSNLFIGTAGGVTNGGTLVVADDPNGTNFSNVNFTTGNTGGSTTDYLSTGLVWRDTSGTVDNMVFDKVMFTSGPDQVSDKSWSPIFSMMPGEVAGTGAGQNVFYEFKMSNSYWNRRGIAFTGSGGGTFEVDNMYRQGGITPMFAFESQNICTQCSSFTLTNEAQDTEGEPVIANLYAAATSNISIGTTVTFNTVSGANGNGPLISGTRPAYFKMDGYVYANALNIPNRDSEIGGFAQNFTYAPYATTGSFLPIAGNLKTFASPVNISAGHSLYFPLQPPSSVTSAISGAGSVPASAWYYAVNATGADGGETILSVPATPLTPSGAQGVLVSWTAPVGAYTFNVYRCTTSCLASDGTANNGVTWVRLAQHQTGTSYTDTAASGTAVNIPQVTATGSTVANNLGLFSLLFQCDEGTAPTGVAGADILYCDSATHQFRVINNNGASSPLGAFGGTISLNQVAVGTGSQTLGGSGSLTFASNVLNAPAISTGSGCTPAGSTATGGVCFTEATSTGWTPTAGFDYVRGDTTHSLLASLNGGTEKVLPPITGATTIGDCVQFAAGPTLADAGSSCGGGSGGANVALSNLAGVGINTTLLPGAVNTVAIGSNALSFTNLFLGTVANQTGSFNTANLTANRVINWPDATSSPIRDTPAVTHQFMTQCLVATGICSQAQPTLADIAAGVSPTGLFDFTAATMEVPEAAGFTANVNSTIGNDTTANSMHMWISSADALVAGFASAPAGSKCVQTSGTVGLLAEVAGVCGTTTPTSTESPINKSYNAEGTGNNLSEPVKLKFPAALCNNSTPGNGWNIGTTNVPTPQCSGTTVRKGVLQYARGNVAYLPTFELPSDWNSSASTDIRLCYTTTDVTNTDVTSFNIQTAFNKTDGTATDDPSLNALQALSHTNGSNISSGEICAMLTGMTMTGSAAGYNMEVAITRNNSGTDTNTDTAVAVKSAEITIGVTKNAANR